MKKWVIGLAVVGAVQVSCAREEAFQKSTAEFTGCSTGNIQISDVNWSGPNSWKAICKTDARIYQCTKVGCTETK